MEDLYIKLSHLVEKLKNEYPQLYKELGSETEVLEQVNKAKTDPLFLRDYHILLNNILIEHLEKKR